MSNYWLTDFHLKLFNVTATSDRHLNGWINASHTTRPEVFCSENCFDAMVSSAGGYPISLPPQQLLSIRNRYRSSCFVIESLAKELRKFSQPFDLWCTDRFTDLVGTEFSVVPGKVPLEVFRRSRINNNLVQGFTSAHLQGAAIRNGYLNSSRWLSEDYAARQNMCMNRGAWEYVQDPLYVGKVAHTSQFDAGESLEICARQSLENFNSLL